MVNGEWRIENKMKLREVRGAVYRRSGEAWTNPIRSGSRVQLMQDISGR